MKCDGKWALVTGASAGIGEAFARALAEKGAHLVLTARRGDRLNRLAANLKEKYAIETVVVEADLSDPDAPEKIAAAISGREIAILVNNAGYGQGGAFEQSDWRVHRDFIELMATSYAHLVHLFLPAMQARNYGRIINVASVSGLIPGSAGHTLYGATKAFLVSFSQSLAAENAGTGVHVSALCPGFTYTEFHDVNGTRHLVSALPKFMVMPAEPVVLGALRAVERRHVVYVPGLQYKAIVRLAASLPRPIAAALVSGGSARVRKAR